MLIRRQWFHYGADERPLLLSIMSSGLGTGGGTLTAMMDGCKLVLINEKGGTSAVTIAM
jgi:hypothetical protein